MNLYRNQLGATLIESVVALFVFSVGILGVAAIQASSLARGDDVKQRSLAIWKASELVDRMRATRTPFKEFGEFRRFEDLLGQDIGAVTSYERVGRYQCEDAPPTSCADTYGSDGQACTAEELVGFDLWSVLCDQDSGASDVNVSESDGVNKLKGLDIALVRGRELFPDVGSSGQFEYRLYMSWLARSAERNEASRPDDDLKTFTTELCGEEVEVDSRLEAYCVSFL